MLEISWFYTCLSKSAIIWCTVPEIRSETDRIFCHFGPFFVLLLHNPKKHLRYHHFTQVYQKSWSYAILFLRYGTWWIGFLFFILGYVLPFYSLNNWKKTKLKKKKKKTTEISFYTCVPKIMIMRSTVPETWCTRTEVNTDGLDTLMYLPCILRHISKTWQKVELYIFAMELGIERLQDQQKSLNGTEEC